MKRKPILLLSLAVILASGCATTARRSPGAAIGAQEVPTSEPRQESREGPLHLTDVLESDPFLPEAVPEGEAPAPNASASTTIEELLAADEKIEPVPHAQIPIEINAYVQKWIDFFTLRDRERFRKFLERGMIYRELVHGILKEHNVPQEMYYLAMIESGYVTFARSRAKAVGAWQFISATGRRYGLKRDHFVDERRDIIRATHSAARYLKDLHDEFGSWYLAMAAYNAGEGRIRRAIRRSSSRDFWELVNRRALPRETMNYVPKFLAAMIIGRNPSRFGFEGLRAERFPEVVKATVPGSVKLEEIASQASLSTEQLKFVNPHLLKGMTPRGRATYEIWAPRELAAKIESGSARYARFTGKLPAEKSANSSKKRALASNKTKVHKVRRGETLYEIASRYRLSVDALKRMNGLQSNRIRKGQKLRILAQRT